MSPDCKSSFALLRLVFLLCLMIPGLVPVQAQKKESSPATQDQIDAAIDKGTRWLVAAQEVDGGWKGPHPHGFQAGMTGLAVYTLLKTGMPADHRVIRKGLAFMNAKDCVKTYEVGTNLLAYSAIPAKMRPKKRVRALTELLITTIDQDGWRYNRPENNMVDLSNSQYAVLGLRAAVAMGEKVPATIWEQAAETFMRLQGHYGGWCYTPKEDWADAGMTSAGLFCLAACLEQLKDRKKARKIVHKLKGRVDLGMMWFEKNWSVELNTIQPASKDARVRWHYHYLYGLERVAALTRSDRIGGHDWYGEGASWLVKKQGAGGAWGTIYGEYDVNSCLALLFLARGTNSTSTKTRNRAVDGKESETFTIRTNGENPALAWIMKLDKKVTTRLDAGEKVAALAWDIDGKEVRRIEAGESFSKRDEKFYLKHQFTSNGRHDVRARLIFSGSSGADAGEEASSVASMWVDNVEGPGDTEAIADAGKNRLAVVETVATASSEFSKGTNASAVCDGLYSTSWLCAENDRKPRISLTLGKRTRASTLKFAGASDYGKKDDDWARPKDVLVVVNGRKKISLTLPDDVNRKHTVAIGKMTVRKLRIEILSVYPGQSKKTCVGIKEIELFK